MSAQLLGQPSPADAGVGSGLNRAATLVPRPPPVYLDANHGFLNQYPELFADHVKAFLNGGYATGGTMSEKANTGEAAR